MDAGIATEDNLALLRGEGYDYVCVPLSKPDTKLLAREEEKELSTFPDQRGNQIQARWVNFPGEEDNFLYLESEMKEKKEKSIQELHCLRYEAGLQAIKEGIEKKEE